jgi:outer membrane protein assembly factor BamB
MGMNWSAVALGIWLWPGFVEAAAEWFQWRGPNRDGHSPDTGLLTQWPPDGPPLLWKATGLGTGYSGVSLAAGKIFTMGDLGPDSCLLALDAAQGKTLWSTPVGRSGGGGGHPGPRCTPTFDAGQVFALNQHGDLICAEADTGKLLWRKSLPRDFGGRMMSGWGYSESPLVDGPRVVVTPGGKQGTLLALDRKTGQRLWQTKEWTDSAAYASVVVAEFGGVRQYVQITDESVAGVRATDGKVLWRIERRGRTAVVPTPIVHGNYVYVTSGYGVGCNLIKVTASSQNFTAQQVYANKTMVNHHGGVVLVKGYLYGYSDGRGWVCQAFETGQEVWSSKALGKGSIAYADGLLICRDERPGNVVLLEATPEGYREKGRFLQPDRTKERSWPHPVISGGKLYLRDQDLLLCYDLRVN